MKGSMHAFVLGIWHESRNKNVPVKLINMSRIIQTMLAAVLFAVGMQSTAQAVDLNDTSVRDWVWWTDPPHTYTVKGLTNANRVHIHQKTSLCTPSSRCDQMILMYSEDDAICKPLLNIYQRYWGKQKEENSTVHDRLWWEDSQPDLFVKAGFVPPSPLKDERHGYVPTTSSMLGEDLALVYYQLRLDSHVDKQTVLLRDFPYRSHEFHSDIFVSEPGDDISILCGADSFVATSPGATKACGAEQQPLHKLAFATYFFDYGEPDEIRADKLISVEYVFKKNDTFKKYAGIYDGEIISAAVGISRGIIQRVYLFHNFPIFIARNTDSILVYRLKNGSEMNDVCHIASNVAKINR
jgi:hypothetical protein